MQLTSKQLEYVQHRRGGMRPTAAAAAAGYSGPRTAGHRLERHADIRAALDGDRAPALPATAVAAPEIHTAEELLEAVVRGQLEADTALRVSAARALIAYQEKRKRAPLKPEKTPTEQGRHDKLVDEKSLLDEWAAKAAAVRARLARNDK